jgi:hypothetical protein
MQNTTSRLGKRNAARTVVAAACAVVLTSFCTTAAHASDPAASTQSAALSVSATVLRRCTVTTPALVVVGDEATASGTATVVGDSVALNCSEGDSASVFVGPPSAESALLAQLDREVHAARVASAVGPTEPLVVTVLF